MSRKILITHRKDLPVKHQKEHPGYEYHKQIIAHGDRGDRMNVSVYQVPPGKAAYPYHHHYQSDECFYVISGEGLLRTPQGEQRVTAGDILYFPAGEAGAHKLSNASDSEPLVYLDCDSYHSPELSFMPDSGKTVIYGEGLRKIMRDGTDADYYDGE